MRECAQHQARLALVERDGLAASPFVNPELVTQEEDWMNHGLRPRCGGFGEAGRVSEGV